MRLTGSQRHAQLLLVGRSVFAERGLDGTSVQEIADRAGVSKPVVYEHFGGKEGLHAEVVDAEVQHLLQALAGALAGDSPRRLLEQSVTTVLAYVEDRSEGFRLLLREASSPGSSGSLAAVLVEVTARVAGLLAQELDACGSDPARAALYAHALVGQVVLVALWYLDDEWRLGDRRVPRAEVAAQLVELAWDGLGHLRASPGVRAAARP